MSAITSKQFKKMYADTMDNVSGKGVWSGGGTGIPVGGAIGGGDGYKQKIGRGKRPYYKDDQGSPSQSADGGFATYSARVNKGWEGIDAEFVMFPEQEEDVIDIYDYEEIDPVVSRKLPKTYKIKNEMRSLWHDDDIVVAESRYSLENVYPDEPLSEVAWTKILPAIADVGWETILDVGRSGVSWVTGDTIGAAGFALKNISELNSDMEAAIDALKEHEQSPSKTTRDRLEEVLDDLTEDAGDLAAVIADAVDSVSPVGNVVGVVGSVLQNLQKFFRKTKISGAGIRASAYTQLYEYLTKIFGAFVKSGDAEVPDEASLLGVPGMIMDLAQTIENYDGGIGPLTGLTDPVPAAAVVQDVEPPEPVRSQSGVSYLSSMGQGPKLRDVFREDLNMRYNLLRLLESDEEYEGIQPQGYVKRDVPMTDELQDMVDNEILKGFDDIEFDEDYAVRYKADAGDVHYSKRSLSEDALRRFIKEVLSSDPIALDGLQEEDEEDVDEASTVGMGGGSMEASGDLEGWTGPLEAESDWAQKARENAKFFGGGRLEGNPVGIMRQAQKWSRGNG